MILQPPQYLQSPAIHGLLYRWPAKCESVATERLNSAAPDLLAALKALTSNPHISLGDLVYTVRDREGKGWDGPAVTAWGDAVQQAEAAIAKAEGRQS